MKAVILLGGLGTRLRPFTLKTPKPLLPVLNRPFLAFQVDQLRRHGVREIVLALGYKSAHFKRALGSGDGWGARFTYSLEKTPLGTGGALRKALPRPDGPCFVLNGDALSDIDLSALLRLHRRRRSQATFSLARVPDASAFGVVETDAEGRVLHFLEKSAAPGRPGAINAGVYVFEPGVVRRIPEGRPVSLEREVFPALLRDGLPSWARVHGGYWSDIGTLASYWDNHRRLLAEAHPSVPGRRVRPGLWAEAGARFPADLKVEGAALLGRGCRVGPSVTLAGFVCLGPGCVVGAGARLSDCVVHAGARIGAGAVVERALLGENCRLQDHAHAGPGQALAPGSTLGSHSTGFPALAISPRP